MAEPIWDSGKQTFYFTKKEGSQGKRTFNFNEKMKTLCAEIENQGDWSMEAWIFIPEFIEGERHYIAQMSSSLLSVDDKGGLFFGTYNDYFTGGIVKKSSWTHVAATYISDSPDTKKGKLYVNGVKVDSYKGVGNRYSDNLETFVVGGTHNSAHKFTGEIKYLKIYDKALSKEEVEDSIKQNQEDFHIEMTLGGNTVLIHHVVQEKQTREEAEKVIRDLNELEYLGWRFLTFYEAQSIFGYYKIRNENNVAKRPPKDFKQLMKGHKINIDNHFFWINEEDTIISLDDNGAAYKQKITSKEDKINLIIVRDNPIEMTLAGKPVIIHSFKHEPMSWKDAEATIKTYNDADIGHFGWRFLTEAEAQSLYGFYKQRNENDAKKRPPENFRTFMNKFEITDDKHHFWVNERDKAVSLGGAAYREYKGGEGYLIIVRDKTN